MKQMTQFFLEGESTTLIDNTVVYLQLLNGE